MKRLLSVVAAVVLLSTAFEAQAETYKKTVTWNNAKTSGWFTDPDLWNGEVAPADDPWVCGQFGDNTVSLLLTCPAGGSSTFASYEILNNTNVNYDRTVTIDTTQGMWTHGPSKWLSSWQGFAFKGNNQIFNLESINSSSSNVMFTLSGGTLTFHSGKKLQLVLDGATWNMYDPPHADGVKVGGASLYVGVSGANPHFIVTNNACLRMKDLFLRGNGNGGNQRISIYGGSHYLSQTLMVNDGCSADNLANTCRVDLVDAEMSANAFTIGNLAQSGSPAAPPNAAVTDIINLRGSTRLTMRSNGNYIGYSCTRNPKGTHAFLNLSDDAVLTLPDAGSGSTELWIGANKTGSANFNHATLSMKDNSQLVFRGRINVGCSPYCDAKLLLSGNAVLKRDASLYSGNNTPVIVGQNAFATGVVEVVDHACIADYAGDRTGYTFGFGDDSEKAVGILNVRDSGTVDIGSGTLSVGRSVKSTGFASFTDNATVVAGSILLGADATSTTCEPGCWCHVDGAGATLTLGTSFGIRGVDSTFDLTNGTVTVNGSSVSVSEKEFHRGNTLSLFGGTFSAPKATVSVAAAAGATGTVNLKGGTLTARGLVGGSGTATLNADGSQFVAAPSADSAFLGGFATATLGARGLTVDTSAQTLTTSQAFADADAAEGLLVKTGAGTLVASANSDHAKTYVDGGTLKLGAGVTHYGKSLAADHNGVVSLEGAATTLAVDSLTLGDATTDGAVTLDAGDTIVVADALTVNNGSIILAGEPEDGEYTVFTSETELADGIADCLRVINRASGKSYVFARAADGKSVTLTIADATPQTMTWTGATDSDFSKTSNWADAPAHVPGENDTAVFPDGAMSTVVSLGRRSVGQLAFTGVADYTLSGELLRDTFAIMAAGGEVTIDVPMQPNATLTVTNDAGALTLAGDIVAPAGTLTKGGKGELVLAGTNVGYVVKTVLGGGRLTGTSAAAFGPADASADAIAVAMEAGAGNVLSFDNAEPLTLRRGVTVTGNAPVAIDVRDADVEFAEPLTLADGGFVKTGPGRLTLNYPAGTFSLSRKQGDCGGNKSPSGDVTFGDDGNTPAWTGLAGMSILDGTLYVKGQGATKTTIDQKQWGYVGGGNWKPEGNPRLVFDSVTANVGGSGFWWWLGWNVPERDDGGRTTVSLALVNGAAVEGDTLHLGYDSGCHADIWIAITNSTMKASYGYWMPRLAVDGVTHVRLSGSTAKMESTTTNQAGDAGFGIGGAVDFVAENGATMTMATGASNGTQLKIGSGAKGTVKFGKDAVLTGCGFRSNSSTALAGALEFVFDGAKFNYYNGPVLSCVAQQDQVSFTVAEGGLDLVAPSGRKPQLTFPFGGVGKLTKSGAGELMLGPCIANHYNGTKPVTNDVPVVACAKFAITDGTVKCSAADVISPNTAVEIADGYVLDLGGFSQTSGPVTGPGTVRNGTFTGKVGYVPSATAADVPTFENVTFGERGVLRVDFGVTDDPATALPKDTPLVLFKLGADATPTRIRGVNRGRGIGTLFTTVDGTVYATAQDVGLMIFIR